MKNFKPQEYGDQEEQKTTICKRNTRSQRTWKTPRSQQTRITTKESRSRET
jgi:hypothetical protein